MTKKIIEILPFIFIVGWSIFSVYYILRARRKPDSINKYIFESIPQIFATIGILGTFMGIAYGLSSFDVTKIENSIPQLLDGLKTAFYASIAGITLLIISSKFIAVTQKKYEKVILSDEVIALNKIIELLTEMNTNMGYSVNIVSSKNNKSGFGEDYLPGSALGRGVAGSTEQPRNVSLFSGDIPETIAEGYERLLEIKETVNTIPPSINELHQEIITFGTKVQESTTEMTQNVIKDLAVTLENIVQEFKTSVSDSTKEEMEKLIALLTEASATILDFPARFQSINDNLNQNFKLLQEMLIQMTQQTIEKNNESTSGMKKQLDEIHNILKYFYTIYA